MNSLRTHLIALVCLSLILLAGCSGSGKRGGYYQDDGPGFNVPPDIAAIPDAVPRIERHAPANLRPYVVFGKRYVPIRDGRPHRETGIASWYGRKFHGNRTANGETYNMYAMTAAHPILPIPSYARVTRGGRSIIVRINDRGPFHSGRVIDLSYVAAAKLGLIGPGSGQVIVEAITPDEIRNNTYARGNVSPAASSATPAVAAAPPASPRPRIVQSPASQSLAANSPSAPPPAPRQPSSQPAINMNAPQPDPITGLLAARIPGTGFDDDDDDEEDDQDDWQDDTGQAPAIPDALAALQHTTPAFQTQYPNPASSSGAVYLQFGAFANRVTAEALAQRVNSALEGNGEPAHLERTSNHLYRVQIGPFPSRTAAVNAAMNIQQNTGLEPLVAAR